jgi:hypothetical protein
MATFYTIFNIPEAEINKNSAVNMSKVTNPYAKKFIEVTK